jgi:hypothetical protein
LQLTCQRFHPEVELRFIAGGGILLYETRLGGAIDDRKGGGQKLAGFPGIFFLNRAPHGADLMPQSALASAIEFRAPFCLPYPLECGISVCHRSSFQDNASGKGPASLFSEVNEPFGAGEPPLVEIHLGAHGFERKVLALETGID